MTDTPDATPRPFQSQLQAWGAIIGRRKLPWRYHWPDASAAILLMRLTSRPIPEICAMGGITLEDFTQSVAYKEIFGLGEQRGREQGLEQGLKTGELGITMRLLQRRCGGLTPSQEARIRALPLPQLEALAEALLDFKGADDLDAWLVSR
jgi:predicted transposase YdaD